MNDFHSDSQGHPLVEDLSTALLAGSVIFSDGSNLAEDNDNFFWDNIKKALELTHVATESDDHAFEIDVDADGFGNVKALNIPYDTGAITTGQNEGAILVQFDEFDATGGNLAALAALTTEGGADKVIGLFAGVLVNPIEQLSGVFADMDSALVNASDELADLINEAVDTNIFVADDDTVTIGDAAKFEEIEFILTTVSSGAGIRPKFEFSTGVGTWAEFNPTDGTNGMRNNGVIAFLDSDIPTWAVGTGTEFLIRITRERNSLTTTPVAKLVQIAAVTEFFWNKDGDVSVKSLTASDLNPGSVLFGGASGLIKEDNANLFWDDTNNRLGIGTNAPIVDLHLENTSSSTMLMSGDSAAFVLRDINATADQGVIQFNLNADRLAIRGLTDVFGQTVEFISFKLDTTEIVINEGGEDLDFRIENDTNENAFFVQGSSGNIGMGTNTPEQDLHLVGDGEGLQILLDSFGGNNQFVGRSANGTLASPTATLNNDILFALAGRGHDGTDFSVSRGLFAIEATQNWTASAQGTRMTFDTTENGTTSRLERMIINHDGNVGIGTTSPNAKLDVRGSAIFNEEGGDNDFRIEGDTETNLFFVDASTDFIGVRTNSPSAPLHLSLGDTVFTVNPSTTCTIQNIDSGNDNTGVILSLIGGTGANANSQLAFGDSDNEFAGRIVYTHGTTDAMRFFINAAERMRIDSGGNMFIAGTSASNADITLNADGSAVFNEQGNDADFRIEGDTDTNIFFVDASTNRVGIGTATPDDKLHMVNDGALNFKITNSSASGGTGFIIETNTGITNRSGQIFMDGNGDFRIRIIGATANGITIEQTTGDVGINTASPGATLDVRGSAIFNEDGGDNDFRVEGDTMTHMIFLEGNAASENIALLAASLPNWQSMDRGIFIGNSTTVPTGAPSGGGFLYVESGALKYRGSSGNITVLGIA